MRATAPTALFIAAALLAAGATQAQNAPGGEEKGSKNQSQGIPEVYDDAQARDQPALATGKDLKGPPTQLPPSKTPE